MKKGMMHEDKHTLTNWKEKGPLGKQGTISQATCDGK